MYPRLLILIQFLLSTTLVLLGAVGLWRNHPWLMVGVFLGAALGVHAVLVIGPAQLRIHPEPGASATLRDQGVYHWIRHPMYAGLLLGTGCLAFGVAPPWLGALLWAALAVDLVLKAQFEEQLLRRHWPAYGAYMKRTKRLIPGIY